MQAVPTAARPKKRTDGRARVGHKAQPLLARVRRRAAGLLVVIVRRELGLVHRGRHTADSPASAPLPLTSCSVKRPALPLRLGAPPYRSARELPIALRLPEQRALLSVVSARVCHYDAGGAGGRQRGGALTPAPAARPHLPRRAGSASDQGAPCRTLTTTTPTSPATTTMRRWTARREVRGPCSRPVRCLATHEACPQRRSLHLLYSPGCLLALHAAARL